MEKQDIKPEPTQEKQDHQETGEAKKEPTGVVEPPQAKPYKVDSEDVERDYEVLENGDVIMSEKMCSKVYFASREFTTWVRSHQIRHENIMFLLSDQYRTENEENKALLESKITPLKSLQEESEANVKEAYDLQKRKALLGSFKEQIEGPEADRAPADVTKVWHGLTTETREFMETELSDEEMKVLRAIMDSAPDSTKETENKPEELEVREKEEEIADTGEQDKKGD